MKYRNVFAQTFRNWRHDQSMQLAAATAYYAIFSLAPFMILVLALSGLLIEPATVEEALFSQGSSIIGQSAAEAVQSMVRAAQSSPGTPLAAVLSILLLLWGASGLLDAMQQAMNRVWNVEIQPEKGGLHLLVVKRVFSVGVVLVMGFLLLVSLLFSIIIGLLSDQLASAVPYLNFLLTFTFITLLFAVLQKFLPDIEAPWRDIWPGAILSALLFTAAQFALGYYLAQRDFSDTYGVAGSAIILLIWVNYSAQILYFGAEFSQQLADAKGSAVVPKPYAQFVGERVRKPKPSVLQKLGVLLGFVFWRIGSVLGRLLFWRRRK